MSSAKTTVTRRKFEQFELPSFRTFVIFCDGSSNIRFSSLNTGGKGFAFTVYRIIIILSVEPQTIGRSDDA